MKQNDRDCLQPLVAMATPPRQNGPRVDFASLPPMHEGARIASLALALLAGSRNWMAKQSPQLRAVPVEGVAISCATISPWRTPEELMPCVRACLWVYAFDDYIEQSVTDLTQLDEMLQRCVSIVRDNRPDESHWLLTALSSCQLDLASQPLYPALSDLWIEKFESTMRSERCAWTAAQNTQHNQLGLEEYLAHGAATTGAWIAHLPRWITYGDNAVLDRLDVLVSALGEEAIVIRLANDLATFSRERDQPGSDNVLLYGVSPEWVTSEIASRAEATTERLADLLAAEFIPAVELIREMEYATAFYSVADFRGWGSDVVLEEP